MSLRTIAALLLSVVLLAPACRGSGKPDSQRKPAPGGMPGDGPGINVQGAQGPATTLRTITVKLEPLPRQPTGAVAFIGFEASQMEGTWSRLGVAPSHHAVSDPIELTASFEIEIELVGSLTYLAILDLDDDGRPGPGEITSVPTALPEGDGRVSFVLDRPYIPPEQIAGTTRAIAQAPGLPSNEGAEERELIVDTTIRPPFLKEGRILVVGLPASGDTPFQGPLEVEPTFFWASDTVRLDWPVRVKARFPADGDVLVVLDLDGAGAPSLGDLVTEPMLGFEAPAAGEPVQVTLTGPLTDSGEGGD